MNTLFIVNHPRDCPLAIPGVTIVPARAYLTDAIYAEQRATRVFNLCRSNRYQSRGYYVSLLAEARGHRPLPEVKTIEDVQSDLPPYVLPQETRELAQRTLGTVSSGPLELDVYFGRSLIPGRDELAQQIFNSIRIPLLRAKFENRSGEWGLTGVRILSAADLAPQHWPFLSEAATQYLSGYQRGVPTVARDQPRLAILSDKEEQHPASNADALAKFQKAGEALGMEVEFVAAADINRLAEFDALFIRDTTKINHYTYQFSRRAWAEGLVVIDDPDSILKCNNKVYLNELMARHRIATPKTLMVHRGNVDQIIPTLGLPCVLKQPDSAFSLGVAKMETKGALLDGVHTLLETSELVIAQEWLPTEFDWRVGILDRRPLYVCKYFMAPGHWQIIKHEPTSKLEGITDCLSVGETPDNVIKMALRAANLIGDGLYGVDLKQVGDTCYVIEVNDNPNVDAGHEDGVLQGALYREIMGVFWRRIRERNKRSRP